MKDRLTTIFGIAVAIRQFLNADYSKIGSGDRAEMARVGVGVVAILIGIALYNPWISKKMRGGRG